MSDEAFARRFYSDRAELIALGVPLHSQRDEFTGEELYTLRSEQYFLPELELERRRARGAPDGALPPRRQVRVRGAAAARAAEPRARPARLQRAADARPPCASRCSTPTTRPRCRAGSRSSRARSRSSGRSRFPYYSISRDTRLGADAQPVRAAHGQRHLVRRRRGPRRQAAEEVPRLAHPRRHPLRDAPRARLPHADRLRHRRVPRPAAVADRRPRRARRASR